jgi:hypothetical protein
MEEVKVIQITEKQFDDKLQEQTNIILNTVTKNHTIVLQSMGEYNKELGKVKRQTDRNTRDIKDLQSARSFWMRCAIGFSGLVTFGILLWKLISDRI